VQLQAQNSAAQQAQNIAQQQLAAQGITPLGQAQSTVTGGVSGIANQVQGAGAAIFAILSIFIFIHVVYRCL
ncbi:unnamed protein product, partial [marine sediment metagenome]